MLNKHLPVLLTLVLLGGCQQTLPEMLKPIECSLDDQALHDLVALEQQYLTTDSSGRQKLRLQARQGNNDHALALMLSLPEASTAQLEQAELHYRRALADTDSCNTDDYLLLRRQFGRKLADLQRRQMELQQENQQLQEQIKALTEIEQDLSRERELNR
ncbi:hypothetical protein [Marinobacterium arenosum]|uniref:hypothetical protein n=1 Tax=Marinobacterium arenosum TaxID=2862496 RepID=UPI001C95F69C|nr:hypothetical protein [Marinobacterium arenosum]MBY4678501.1 hypothetical protein [Marinobacterium arenosum]